MCDGVVFAEDSNFASMFRGWGMKECAVNGLTTANNG